MKYGHVVRAFADQVWGIQENKFYAICDLVRLRAEGGLLTDDEVQVRINAATQRSEPAKGSSVAVIPIYGVIAQRMTLFGEISGGTSTERVAKSLRAALADSSVGSIVFDVDSPGGTVYGVQELASEIMAARGQKPMVAISNSLMASAAYWIGTAADELVVTPSGEVGSIGVFMVHEDWSKFYEEAGIKPTLIKAGKYKAEGNDIEPLSDEARDYIQGRVNDVYDEFVKAVAKGRGVNASAVKSGFGQGRVVGARDAVKMGMADRIETLDETVARMASTRGRNAITSKAATEAETAVRAEDAAPAPAVNADHCRSRVIIAQRKGAEHGVPAV